MISINNADVTSNTTNNDDSQGYAGDYFGLELMYNKTETGLGNTQYYDGNISAVKWKGPGIGSGAQDKQSYIFGYDKADRLETATSKTNSGSSWTKLADALNESMTYDHNGNISTLKRNYDHRGITTVNGVPAITHTTQLMDDLAYTYGQDSLSKGMPLIKVEDASSNTRGFVNGVNQTTEYEYDINGNLTKDVNKGISSIIYNFLGKPSQINFTDGKVIDYAYDAAGSKLSMSVTKNSVTTTTDYAGGFVYENGVMH
jgi:hypothetical protein